MVEQPEIFEPSDEDNLEELHLVVDPGQTSQRLDQFLSARYPKISRNRIQNAIKAGLVTLNNAMVKPSCKIAGSDHIIMMIPKLPDQTGVEPEDIPLEIIYEDDSVMVINKSPGMIVHPAAGVYKGTLVNALAYHFKTPDSSGVGEKERYGLVHRIDKETSGLLVISKSDFAHAHLSRQFFDHSIEREYLALVWGEPDPKSGTINANIGRDPKVRQRQYVFADGLDGKTAITHYELVESFYYTSLVRCRLETGRTHQIRVHMKYIGHPLFNDVKYDGDRIMKGTIFNKYKQFVMNCYKLVPRFPLHARSLGFIHPETGKKMYFEVDLPDDFKQLIEKWRHYTHFRKNMLTENEEQDED